MNSVGSFFTGSSSQTDARRTRNSSTSSAGNGKKEEEEDVPKANSTVRKTKSTGSYGSKVKCPNNLAVRAVGDIVEDIWDFIGFDETDMIMFQTGVTTGTVYTGNPLVGVAAGIVFSKGDNISKLIIKALSSNIFIKASSKAEALKAAESLPKAIQNNVTRAIKKTSGNYNDYSLKKLSNGNYRLEMSNPGKVPGSKAVYVKEIAPDGTTIKMYKDTFDPNGNLIHRKDK